MAGGWFDVVVDTGRGEQPIRPAFVDAEPRLRDATFDDLAPLVDDLAVGQRILLVTAGRAPSSTGAATTAVP